MPQHTPGFTQHALEVSTILREMEHGYPNDDIEVTGGVRQAIRFGHLEIPLGAFGRKPGRKPAHLLDGPAIAVYTEYLEIILQKIDQISTLVAAYLKDRPAPVEPTPQELIEKISIDSAEDASQTVSVAHGASVAGVPGICEHTTQDAKLACRDVQCAAPVLYNDNVHTGRIMMSTRIFNCVFAAVLILAGVTGAIAGASPCVCPVEDATWQVLPDSATAPPDFLFEPYVDVRKVVMCDHGVFFFFNSRYRGEEHPTVLAYPLPSQEQIGRYHSSDELVSSPQAIAEETVKATVHYAAFRNSLHRALGMSRASGRAVSFNRVHRPPPRLRFGAPMTVEYRHATIPLQGLIDVYYRY